MPAPAKQLIEMILYGTKKKAPKSAYGGIEDVIVRRLWNGNQREDSGVRLVLMPRWPGFGSISRVISSSKWSGASKLGYAGNPRVTDMESAFPGITAAAEDLVATGRKIESAAGLQSYVPVKASARMVSARHEIKDPVSLSAALRGLKVAGTSKSEVTHLYNSLEDGEIIQQWNTPPTEDGDAGIRVSVAGTPDELAKALRRATKTTDF